ncbi:MAG: hypothetical protein EBQ92_00755 [Proteobacteria bacterium]|nr:hypothetical protein [Pseudomonadota bacterium]
MAVNGHFGFPAFMKSSDRTKSMKTFFEYLIEFYKIDTKVYDIMIFGEFCGDNIQPFDIALIHLPKCFVMFDAKLIEKQKSDTDYNRWLKIDMKNNNKCIIGNSDILLYNVYDFQTYEVQIDMSNPEPARIIIEHFTINVDNECPFAKQLGIIGKGEGIVWRMWDGDKCLSTFKTKGDSHKVKKEKNVVTFSQENVESVKEFIDKYCTDNRIDQFITKLYVAKGVKVEMKNIPEITDHVFNDIISEESANIGRDVDMANAYKQISYCVKKYLTNFLTK